MELPLGWGGSPQALGKKDRTSRVATTTPKGVVLLGEQATRIPRLGGPSPEGGRRSPSSQPRRRRGCVAASSNLCSAKASSTSLKKRLLLTVDSVPRRSTFKPSEVPDRGTAGFPFCHGPKLSQLPLLAPKGKGGPRRARVELDYSDRFKIGGVSSQSMYFARMGMTWG